MNPKEIKEIRGRFRADHNSITSIFGCYVNTEGNIIAHINESISSLTEEEAKRYFGLLRKMFAGKLGKDLLNLEFTGEQEQEEEYKKLLAVVQGKFDSDT